MKQGVKVSFNALELFELWFLVNALVRYRIFDDAAKMSIDHHLVVIANKKETHDRQGLSAVAITFSKNQFDFSNLSQKLV